MGTGKEHRNGPGAGIGEEIKKAKQAYKAQHLKEAQLEQLTWLNQELLQQLEATRNSHRSLMKYLEEMHRNLKENYHRTPIEEIWFRELGRYLREMEQ